MKILNNLRKAEEEKTKLKDEMQKLEDIFPLTSIPPKHPPLALVLTIQQIKRLAAVAIAKVAEAMGSEERRDGDPPTGDEE
ncbi:hypothetical protein Dimus_016097, partial [Dionaea muscipula]